MSINQHHVPANKDMQVPTSASIGVPFPEVGELCAGLCAIAAMENFLTGSVPGAGSSSFILLVFWFWENDCTPLQYGDVFDTSIE